MAGVWRQPQDTWTAYWRTGQTTSLAEGAEPSEALDQHWREFFSELPQGARILDLGAGNGAVTRLAQIVANDQGAAFEITGVDAADVGGRARTQRDAAAPFLAGGVHIEALPYRASSFDAVTSQFGFEYACELDAVRELARVLKPGGKMRLILHARDGAIFAAVSQRLNRLRRITIKSGLIEAILYGAAARTASDKDGEALADMTIASQSDGLTSLLQDAPPKDSALFYTRGLINLWTNRDRYAPAHLFASVSDASDRINAHRERLSAMIETAHSPESLRVLQRLLTYSGVAASPPRAVIDRNSAQIAWLMDGARHSA
ncbi:MAG TPA: hypothetical protein DHW63_06280 [Hyphomonadaceae bacterium]|nr:hypothetical protein [Hyphomonadaceae bacterium]